MADMKIVGIAVVVIIVVAGIGLWYMTSQQPKPKVLVMGTSADFPPFEYVAENGTIIGFDIDIAKYIAKKWGYKLEIKDISFDGLIPALQAGQIDMIVAALTITPERQQSVDFSKPYYNATQAILIRANFPDITNESDLYGLKIGVQAGTTGEAWADEHLNTTCTITAYQRVYDAITALKAGYIDALILDDPVARYYNSTDTQIKMASWIIDTGERYGIAVAKGNTKLLNEINEALDELFSSGLYEEYIARWFG
ncbi:MAG: basic amino acid ABC transporter substrate-binding protein [Candidatus Njordarchaeia archaeon]